MLPKEKIAHGAIHVISKLQEAGFEAHLVGGAVRDILLDLEPKDFDVATSATPEEVRGVFRGRARIIGRRFRLVHVYADHMTYEVSTFRRQPSLEERKGRDSDDGLIVWRDNEWGTLDQDALRRDFTVNAIYYDPVNAAQPIFDVVGGLADIENRTVRCIGDPHERMAEDPVRMLRACKLVGQYGFVIEPELLADIRRGADQLALASQARMLEELYKVFKKPYACRTFSACQDVGILKHMLPELAGVWDEPIGQLTQSLLAVRDRKLDVGELYPSRVSGLVLVVLPFIWSEFGNPEEGEFWQNYPGIDRDIHNRVRALLEPYRVPRHMISKIRDCILLQPKLLHGANRKRTINHPTYPRARDIFSIFCETAQLDPTILERWPIVSDTTEDEGTDDEPKPERTRTRRRRRRK